MLKYTIPFYYYFRSRLNTLPEKLSWIVIYLIPVTFVSYYSTDYNISEFSIIYIVALTLFHSLYEIGYLENDFKTVKQEILPTVRFAEAETDFIKNNYKQIVLIKSFTAFILLIIIILYQHHTGININTAPFILCLLGVWLFFTLHNTYRNRFNIVTYFALVCLRYISVSILLLKDIDSLIYSAWLIVLFPIVRSLEFASKAKYRIRWLTYVRFNHDLFRVQYYLAAAFISLMFLATGNSQIASLFIGSALYFLCYRSAVYMLLQRNAKVKSKYR